MCTFFCAPHTLLRYRKAAASTAQSHLHLPKTNDQHNLCALPSAYGRGHTLVSKKNLKCGYQPHHLKAAAANGGSLPDNEPIVPFLVAPTVTTGVLSWAVNDVATMISCVVTLPPAVRLPPAPHQRPYSASYLFCVAASTKVAEHGKVVF